MPIPLAQLIGILAGGQAILGYKEGEREQRREKEEREEQRRQIRASGWRSDGRGYIRNVNPARGTPTSLALSGGVSGLSQALLLNAIPGVTTAAAGTEAAKQAAVDKFTKELAMAGAASAAGQGMLPATAGHPGVDPLTDPDLYRRYGESISIDDSPLPSEPEHIGKAIFEPGSDSSVMERALRQQTIPDEQLKKRAYEKGFGGFSPADFGAHLGGTQKPASYMEVGEGLTPEQLKRGGIVPQAPPPTPVPGPVPTPSPDPLLPGTRAPQSYQKSPSQLRGVVPQPGTPEWDAMIRIMTM